MLMDTNFINAKVYTMETEDSICEAFSVYDGKLIACGTTEEILKNPAKKIIDVQGKAVLPGFIDTHQHTYYYSKSLRDVDLRTVTSWAEAKAKLSERAAITPKGDWIKGISFNNEKWDVPNLPTKEDLDGISLEHPILIDRYCLHVHVVNSEALRLSNIVKGFVPSTEGTIGFDGCGEPNGIIWDSAIATVLQTIPDPVITQEGKKDAVEIALREMNRYGITGAHPIQGKLCDAEESLGIYQALNKEGRLTVRVYVSFDEYPCFGMRTGFGDEKVRYGFFKIYSDGGLGSRSAAFFEPYSDRPEMLGVLNYSQEEIDEMCQKAHDMGLQIGIHAIGDRGMHIALNAIEKVYLANPVTDPRFRVIHASIVNEELISRMKKLPIILDIQPGHVSTNLIWAEERVGPERAKYAWVFRRMIDEGMMLTASSDLPVEHLNPFLGIYALVNRKNTAGFPEDGWYPEQRCTVFEAISMYTKNAAFSSFEENIKGSISVGKLSDFIVLDQDPFEIDANALKDVVVEKTYLSGEEVFSNNH